MAWSLGVPDGAGLGAERAAAVIARIVAAIDVPVSADIEAGYSDVAATVTADALERSAVYATPGADSLFVPGLVNPAAIAELAAGPLPVAVMVWPGAPSVAELAAAGAVRCTRSRWLEASEALPATVGWAGYRREPPGLYEARDRALSGSGGGMLFHDAIRQYRTGK